MFDAVVDVVLAGLRVQANLFDVHDVRLGLMGLAFALVAVLAVVHQFADRWV